MARRPPLRTPGADWRQWVSAARVLGAGTLGVGDGSGLHRLSALIGQPDPYSSATLVYRVRNVGTALERNVILRAWDTNTLNVSLNSALAAEDDPSGPHVAFNSRTDSGVLQFYTGLQSWAAGPDEILYAASIKPGVLTGWANRHGWRLGDNLTGGITPAPPQNPTSNMQLSADQWELLGSNYHFSGDVAFIWLALASDSSAYVDVNDRAVRDMLEGDPTTWTGLPTPIIWFQGPASEWNSGVNRGTGGDFFVNADTPLRDAA